MNPNLVALLLLTFEGMIGLVELRDPFEILTLVRNGTTVWPSIRRTCIPERDAPKCSESCTDSGQFYPACHCDKFCPIFRDCCYDYRECSNGRIDDIHFSETVEKFAKYRQYMTCELNTARQEADEVFGQYMVRRCPENYRNDVIREKCEILDDEITRQQPRTDMKSAVTFRNVYCAQCHNRGLDDTVAWLHDTNVCQTLTPEMIIWAYFQGYKFTRSGYCVPRIVPGVTDRSCMSSSAVIQMENVDTLTDEICLPDADPDTIDKCRTYLDPIFGRVGDREIAFRNFYCAECFGIRSRDLSCGDFNPMPTGTGNGVQSPNYESNIPSLASLILMPPQECGLDEILDLKTGQCRKRKQCPLGQIMFRGQCILNPVDKYAFENPQIENDNDLSVFLELSLDEPLTLLVHRDTSLEDRFKTAFEADKLGMLRTGPGSITELSMRGQIDTIPIRDGHIHTLRESLSLKFTVKRNRSRGDTLNRLFNSLHVYNGFEYYVGRFHAWFSIYSRVVERPLTCERGELMTIQLDVTYTYLLGHLQRSNISETHLIEYNQYNNDVRLFPQMYICNLVLPKFHNCSEELLNYTKDDFVKTLDGVVSDYGTIRDGDYFISKDQIFTCKEMISSKQDLINAKVLGYITIAGFLFSLVFLSYTLLTYFLFSTLRTTPGKLIMNLCAILFLAEVSLLISKLGANHQFVCSLIGLVQHYLWLTMFFCMNAIAIFTVRTFASRSLQAPADTDRSFRLAMAYTYGLPLILIAVCLGFHFSGEHGIYGALNEASSCWIKSRSIFLYAFVAPFSSLLAINLVLFMLTTRAIHATRAATASATTDRGDKWEISLYVRLSFLMGFTWIFGVLGVFYESMALNYLFVLANSFTGVYLAVGFTCTNRVFDLYRGMGRKPRATSVKSPVYSSSARTDLKAPNTGTITA